MRRAGVVVGLSCVVVTGVGGVRTAAAKQPAEVSVLRGDHYGARIFPDNAFTVRDHRQVTGLRVDFRQGVDYPLVGGKVVPACDDTDYSVCDAFAELNTLDGFDLQPRVSVPLTGPVDLGSIDDSNLYITTAQGKPVGGLRQLTFDPATNTLAGISDRFLEESTTYTVRVTSGIKDATGHPIDACGGTCVAVFTTRTASAELVSIRRSLDVPAADSRSAWAQAGITPAAIPATFTQNGTNDVFLAATVAPSIASPLNGIVRNDQTKADPTKPLQSSVVPNLILPPSSTGYYAFGSFLSPRYQYASATAQVDSVGGNTDGVIPPLTTKQTPAPFGADRLGVIVVTPNPVLFPPPWPAAIYGPGFTRSDFDIFVTADYNASLGIVTLATDPSGHGFGPKSTITVTSAGTPTTFLSYGRGRDLDGDGLIGDGLNDGVGPTAHRQADGSYLPSHKPVDGLQSGLIQTVVDNMALGRSIKTDLSIPGVGDKLVDPNRIMYYGLSFGGIYGTMLMGTDPLFNQGLLNVPGGPIVDIARLSGFRGDLATTLSHGRPDLRNGGPGADGFTEDLPLRNEPPEVIKDKGAAQLQELFGQTNWFDRSGSPETFAPRIRLRPDVAWDPKHGNPAKNVVFQSAYGDGTVPNPTAGTLYRAGDLFDRVVYYRNDKTPTYASDPHGWLADPTLAGRTSGEQQLGAFLATGQLLPTNPLWLETPVVTPNDFECLHYDDPQTGHPIARQLYPQSGDCPAAPSHGTLPASARPAEDNSGPEGGDRGNSVGGDRGQDRAGGATSGSESAGGRGGDAVTASPQAARSAWVALEEVVARLE